MTPGGHDQEVHAAQLKTDGLIMSGSWDGDVTWSNFFVGSQIKKVFPSQINKVFPGPDGGTSHVGDG